MADILFSRAATQGGRAAACEPIFLLLTFFAGGFTSAAEAKTYTFNDEKISLSAPDDWTQQPFSGVIFLQSPDLSRLLSLYCNPENPMPPMDSPGMDFSLAQKMAQSPVSAFGHVTLAGVDFIACDSQEVDPKHKGILYYRMYMTEANGYLIMLTTCSLNGPPPQDDSDLKNIVDSFAFIGPPQLPMSYRDQKMTREIILVGGALVVLVVLAAIVFFIWGFFRRRRLAGP
jgi:hypothetical protein